MLNLAYSTLILFRNRSSFDRPETAVTKTNKKSEMNKSGSAVTRLILGHAIIGYRSDHTLKGYKFYSIILLRITLLKGYLSKGSLIKNMPFGLAEICVCDGLCDEFRVPREAWPSRT